MKANKRIFLLLIGILTIVNISKAQIPNPGFENWSNFSFHSDPTGWTSSNVASLPWHTLTVCEKDTDHTEGSFSVRLSTKYDSTLNTIIAPQLNSKELSGFQGLKYPSFPLNQRPLALAGDWKFDQGVPTNILVYINISKWNFNLNKRDTLGMGILNPDVLTQLNWTTFTCVIDYQSSDDPDSAAIRIKSGFTGTMTEGEYLKIDNLHFTFPDGISDPPKSANFDISPNPANGTITVRNENKPRGLLIYYLLDIQGKMLKRLETYNSTFTIPIDNLDPGLYFIRQESSTSINLKKLIVY